MKRISSIFGLLFLAGCGNDFMPALFGEDSPSTANYRPYEERARSMPVVPGIPDRAALVSYSGAASCADLETAIEDSAVLRMTLQVEQSRAYAHENRRYYEQMYANSGTGGGSGGGTSGFLDSGMAGTGGGSGGGAGASGAGGGPSDYTTTNTQVAGIDEADFVKNDGTRIFVVSGKTLRAVRSWPPESISNGGALQLPGRPVEMFLDGNRAVVYSYVFEGASLPSWCSSAGDSYCSEYYATHTLATLLDVSDLSNMHVIASWKLPGRYHGARKVGSRVFTILNSPYTTSSYGGGLQTWVSSWGPNGVKTGWEIDDEADALLVKNDAIIRARTLDDWIGRGSFTASDGTVSPEQLDCAAVHVPNGPAQYGTATLTSFDLSAPAPAGRTTIFARADEIYMSYASVYVTQRHWWWTWDATNRDVTYVHKFDVSNPAAPAYAASGIVEGWIVDQFSMDEHNGDLRVAHTHRLPSADWWSSSVNRVSVFRPAAGQLTVVGTTPDLAPGERIMSARFMGDTAYVVTFRQTDPLYTIDLSNPAQPTKIGELKIPGFSSYIHPIDANHLLTIGTYQPENGAWNQRAVQLAIFDVSNKAAPVQKFVQLVGSAYSSSSAQTDHRAFNYFPAKKTLAIPFTDWGSSGYSYTSELRLFAVDTATGFTQKGSFRVDDLLLRSDCSSSYGCWSWWWGPQVKRSVMADDYVYAVTTGGVRVAKMNNLANPVGTAVFPYSP